MFPHWRMLITALIIAFGSSFQNGYFMLVYNVPQDVMEDYVNESVAYGWGETLEDDQLKTVWSTVASSNQIGRFISCILAPMFADTLGRRATLLMWSVPATLGIVLQCLAYPTGRFAVLAAGRLISGIYNGMVGIVVPLFLVEIAITSKWRGAVTRIHNVVSVLGSIAALTLGLPELLGTPEKWAYLPLIPLPLLAIEFVWLWRVPDSPLHLIERRHSKTSIDRSLNFYLGETSSEGGKGDSGVVRNAVESADTDKTYLVTTADGRRLLCLWLALSLLASFAGASLTNNYSTAILGNFQTFTALSKYSSLIINIIKLILVLVALYIIDKIGRRALLLSSAWLVTCCYIVLIIIGFFGQSKGLTYLKILFVLVWTSTQYIVNSTAVLIVSESTRQNARAFSLAVFKLVFHISSVLLTLSFPPMVRVHESLAYAIVGVPCLLLCIYLTKMCPETGYKNLLHEEEAGGDEGDFESEKAGENKPLYGHTEHTPLIYSEITPAATATHYGGWDDDKDTSWR